MRKKTGNILCWMIFCVSWLSASEQRVSLFISPEEAKEYDINTLLEIAKKNHYKDFYASLTLANIALEKAEKLENEEAIFDINQAIGFFNEQHNKLDSAEIYYQLALQNALEREDLDNLMSVYTDLGIIHRRLANYNLSKKFHLKALELAQSAGKSGMVETSYHNLGSLYRDVGDYENAVAHYLKAIELTQNRGDIPNVINSKQNLAITYAEARNVELGLKTIKEAWNQALEVGDSILMGIVIFDYGKVLAINQQYTPALEKFHASLDIFQKVHHKPLVARSLFYIADAYSHQNELENAVNYFTKCLFYETYLSLKSTADLHCKMGNLAIKQNKIMTSKEAFEKCLAIAEENDFKEFIQKGNYGLYEVYRQMNASEKALTHLEIATQMKDSLTAKVEGKQIAELQFKYDIEKGEKEIKALELRQNRFMLWGSSILFSVLVLLLVYIVKLRGRNNRRLRLKNEEIQKQNIKLKESNEVLEQFTYVAAHDLKEPLRNIGSFVNLLQRRFGKQFNKEANEYMQYVVNGVARMNDLLIALLEYSTISAQKASEESVDVRSVIEGVKNNLKSSIDEKKALIQYETSLPAIKMAPLHTTQLFQNLISNSLKFSERTPHIQITGRQQHDQIIFSIKDNGIGMNEEYAHKVYNLFHRLNKNSHYEGTGIGLTICKNIVDKYDGKIWFESNAEEGTEFFVSLPN